MLLIYFTNGNTCISKQYPSCIFLQMQIKKTLVRMPHAIFNRSCYSNCALNLEHDHLQCVLLL